MEKLLPIEPNTRRNTLDFARKAGITEERAKYIESMRTVFICWEHDYVKITPEMD